MNPNAFLELLESRRLLSGAAVGVGVGVIASGLNAPTAMDVLPDGRILIAEKGGALRIVRRDALATAPMIQLDHIDAQGERGLIGVTHDPDFAGNHWIYLYHTVAATAASTGTATAASTAADAAHNEVTRYTESHNTVVPGSALDILRLDDLSPARAYHNGGAIHFGADGDLYVGVGENGDQTNAQSLGNLLGKILRIDVSHSAAGDAVNAPKLIPADNPFVGSASGINAAIFALGFRNPFTFAVNPLSGAIYVNDVGLKSWEEIDALQSGGNYGWGAIEGFAAGTHDPLGPGTYHDPLMAYRHGGSLGGRAAIAGGVFYTPPDNTPAAAPGALPGDLNGKYLYADYSHGFIRVFDPAHPGSASTPDTSRPFVARTAANPVDLAMAPDGGLYALAIGAGELVKYFPRTSSSPIIRRQPVSKAVAVNTAALFSVTAIGSGELHFQWQRAAGRGAFADIDNAADANVYPTDPLALSDSGMRYRVLIGNAFGSVISRAVTVAVKRNA
jgi:glucose/arabinose dehydrogenase